MTEKRLNIISIDHPAANYSKQERHYSSILVRTKENQARLERLWLRNPDQFDPTRNCMQLERLERTWNLLCHTLSLKGKRVADIGCGSGVFTRRLREAGANIDAIDISENALKLFREQGADGIHIKQDSMPVSSLPDQAYDVVVCLDVLAELNSQDYRLFFAELARLVKPDGYVVCSTPIDIFTEGGTERLKRLIDTEFTMTASIPSHHAFYIRLKHILEAPDLFVRGWMNPDVRMKELHTRTGLARSWYWLNTTFVFMPIWLALQVITRPLAYFFKQSRWLLLKIESFCKFLWDERGISHFIFMGQRKPLQLQEPEEVPIQRPGKKEVWE